MARKGENIYKRKDGRWEGRYIVDRDISGKAVYRSVYARSYLAVKEKMRTSSTSSERKNPPQNSFGKYTFLWLESVELNNKPSTYNTYRNICIKHLLPVFENCFISVLTTEIAEKYIHSLLIEKQYSEHTIVSILSVFKLILSYARKHGEIISCDISAIKVRQISKEMRVLTVDEQRKFTDYLLNSSDIRSTGILISLYTGIRIGELCALKWDDISFADGTMSITKTMQRIQKNSGTDSNKTHIIITSPKSKCSERIIPVPAFLIDILKKQAYENDLYVLSGNGYDFVEPRNMQKYFKACIEKCGIEGTSFHTLRHTFATRCVEAGFEIKSLSEILGHSSVNITLNRYVHSSIELKRINMEKISLIR